jgi:hypothetical protein
MPPHLSGPNIGYALTPINLANGAPCGPTQVLSSATMHALQVAAARELANPKVRAGAGRRAGAGDATVAGRGPARERLCAGRWARCRWACCWARCWACCWACCWARCWARCICLLNAPPPFPPQYEPPPHHYGMPHAGPHHHPGVKLEPHPHMPHHHHHHPYGAPPPAAPTPGGGRDSSYSQETAVDQEQYGARGSAAGVDRQTSSNYGKQVQPVAGLPDLGTRWVVRLDCVEGLGCSAVTVCVRGGLRALAGLRLFPGGSGASGPAM